MTRRKYFFGIPNFVKIIYEFLGEYSYVTEFESNQVMFHVSQMIPQTPGDPSRKRHLGNDIVVIIYRDENSDDVLDVGTFRSQFNRTVFFPERNFGNSFPVLPLSVHLS
jgi:hypothetical protein